MSNCAETEAIRKRDEATPPTITHARAKNPHEVHPKVHQEAHQEVHRAVDHEEPAGFGDRRAARPETDLHAGETMPTELAGEAPLHSKAATRPLRFRPEPHVRQTRRRFVSPRNLDLTSRLARYWIWLSHATMAAAVVMVLSRISLEGSGMISGPIILSSIGLLLAAGVAAHLAYLRTGASRSVLAGDVARLLDELEHNADEMWELRESEERYRNLSETFGDIVFYRDCAGKLTYANQALAALAGVSVSDLLGRAFPFQMVREKLLTGTTNALIGTMEVRVDTPEGPRWFIWLDMPVRTGDGLSSETVTIARDISVQKEAELALHRAREKAEAASRAKTRFLATVSHEMRTPLNGILGMSRLLDESRLTKSQTSYNEAIHSSGTALLSLIEDLLDITKIEAGRFERRDEAFSPQAMVEEVCELLSSRAYAKDIEIGVFVHPMVPETIVADQGRIRQVLINLLGNAIKFTEKGGVAVALEAQLLNGTEETTDQGPNEISQPQLEFSLAVTDDGPGLMPEDMARIFEEFEQVETVSTRKHGGAGLGLSISQGIAREIGGSLSVESEPGNGSTFSFTFVTKAEAQDARTGTQAGSDPDTGYRRDQPHHILFVSCGETETRMLQKQAIAMGHHVTMCHSIANAHAVLDRDNRYDRVIVNVEGFADVIDNVEDLKAALAPCAKLIVILKPQMRDQLDRYLDLGCDAYLIRPVRLTSLRRILSGEEGAHQHHEPATEPFRSADAENQPKQAGADGVLRVLLAEDNDINALLARTTLEKAGHDVTWVTNGRQAVDKWQTALAGADRFDCILMDLHMPVMDGLGAIAEIRSHEANLAANSDTTASMTKIPILALTADEQDEMRSHCTAAGADGFLVKPFDPARLQQAVQESCLRQTG